MLQYVGSPPSGLCGSQKFESGLPSTAKVSDNNRTSNTPPLQDDTRSTTSAMKRLNQTETSVPSKIIKRSTGKQRDIFALLMQSDPFDLDGAIAAHIAQGQPTVALSHSHESASKSQSTDFLMVDSKGKEEFLNVSYCNAKEAKVSNLFKHIDHMYSQFNPGDDLNQADNVDKYQQNSVVEEENSEKNIFPTAIEQERSNTPQNSISTHQPNPGFELSLMDDTYIVTDSHLTVEHHKTSTPLDGVDLTNGCDTSPSDITQCNTSNALPIQDVEECNVSALQTHVARDANSSIIAGDVNKNLPQSMEPPLAMDEYLDTPNTSSPSLLGGGASKQDSLLRRCITPVEEGHSEQATKALNGIERSMSAMSCLNENPQGKISSPGSNVSEQPHAPKRTYELYKTNTNSSFITRLPCPGAQRMAPITHLLSESEIPKTSPISSDLGSRPSVLRHTDFQSRGNDLDEETIAVTDPVNKSLDNQSERKEDSLTCIDPATLTNMPENPNDDTPCSPDSDCTMISGLDHVEYNNLAKADETEKANPLSDPSLGSVGDQVGETDSHILGDEDKALESFESCSMEHERNGNLSTTVDDSQSLSHASDICQGGEAVKGDELQIGDTGSQVSSLKQIRKKVRRKKSTFRQARPLKPPNPWISYHRSSHLSSTTCADNTSKSGTDTLLVIGT